MKPSECVRRGCILRPQQAFHKLLSGQYASCATAALTEGFIGFRVESSQEVWIVADSALRAKMPWLFDNMVRRCPECHEGQVSGWNAAVHLVPKALKDRWHDCECGLSIGRDDNSSINILALGRSAAGLTAPEVH